MRTAAYPTSLLLLGLAMFAGLPSAFAGDWSAPVEVFHDDKRCISYRARFTGEHLLVEMKLEPGWHTFAMDNERRQAERLKGKPSLGIEKPTGIRIAEGLELTGPWFQTPPKDFSKPEIRWYTYGYDDQALFGVAVRKASGAATAQMGVKAQACTDAVCKNIDVTLSVPLGDAKPAAGDTPVDWKALVEVRP